MWAKKKDSGINQSPNWKGFKAVISGFLLITLAAGFIPQLQSGRYTTRTTNGDNRVAVLCCLGCPHEVTQSTRLAWFHNRYLCFGKEQGEEREMQLYVFCVNMCTAQKIWWMLGRSWDCVPIIQHVKLLLWKGHFGLCCPEVRHCQASTGLIWELCRSHFDMFALNKKVSKFLYLATD